MCDVAGSDGNETDQPHPAASVLTTIEPPVCDPRATPDIAAEVTVTPEKSALGSAACHSDSAWAAAALRALSLSAPLAPTGVAGSDAASRCCVGSGVGVAAGVAAGDADGEGDADGVGVGVGVGDAVGVGVGVGVLAGLPEVQVTELPSAEWTQFICDPDWPDVGAGEGVDCGTTTGLVVTVRGTVRTVGILRDGSTIVRTTRLGTRTTVDCRVRLVDASCPAARSWWSSC
jgi:hypothetical protein